MPTSQRRILLAAVCAVGLVVPGGAELGPTGSAAPRTRPVPTNSAPGGPRWLPRTDPEARRATGGPLAYVALAGGYNVATVDVVSRTVVARGISTDAAQGVAATPDGKKLYIANTGQYDVLVVDAVSHASRRIRVGPFPQDVAVSPDGHKVYATVTGGDTGRGGSDTVAVIDTETDKVVRQIRVGASPRQVVFDRDGAHAYVTSADGVAVIDGRRDRVVRSVRDRSGLQGVAVDPAGRTVYVTSPSTGRLSMIDAATGKVTAWLPAGDHPWAVDVTPDGSAVYVAQMNDNAVAVIDAASRTVRRVIGVGKLPQSVAVTPDGSEVWVGNGLSGNVSVIGVSAGAVIATVSGGTGTKPLDAAPLAIAFAISP